MASKDLFNTVKGAICIAPQNLTATTNGTSVDTAAFESLCLYVDVGASADTLTTNVYWTMSLQDSDDNATWGTPAANAVQSANGLGTIVINSSSITGGKLGYIGNKRYVRPVLTATGSHPSGTLFSLHAKLGSAHHKPV